MKQQTIGEKWHKESEEHLVRDSLLVGLELVLAFVLMTAFGYVHVASAVEDAMYEPPDVIFETKVTDWPREEEPPTLKPIVEAQEKRAEDAKREAEEAIAEPVEDYWYPDYGVSDGGGYDGDWASNLKFSGGGEYGGYSFGWYSQNVMPGGGLDELNGNGRHVDDRDFVCDGDGYIAVAMDGVDRGTTIDTPWGAAKVYDSVSDSDEYTGFVDVYVNY